MAYDLVKKWKIADTSFKEHVTHSLKTKFELYIFIIFYIIFISIHLANSGIIY